MQDKENSTRDVIFAQIFIIQHDTMKKTLLAAAVMLAALCSCTKEGAEKFEGYYSYKLSGTIELKTTEEQSDADQEGTVTIAPDRLTLTLKNEAGQMNILTRDKKSGDMLITMNAMGGDVTTLQATADGDKLEIAPTSRRLPVEMTAGSSTCTVMLSGTGEKLDDVIIINFTAGSGEYSYLGRKYQVSGSKIECVAKSND